MPRIDTSYEGRLIAAQLSDAAYFNYDLYKSGKNPALPVGWRVDVSNSQKVADSQFITFVNDATKQIVIAFKGTDNLSEIKSDLLNSGAAAYSSLKPAADEAFLRIKNSPSYSGYTIVTDGHSLGGGMAQTFAVQHNLSGFGQNSLPIAAASVAADPLFSSELSTWRSSGKSFDAVNTAGDIATLYYGTVQNQFYLDQEPTTISSPYLVAAISAAAMSDLPGVATFKEVVTFSNTIKAHSLSNMIALMKDGAPTTSAVSYSDSLAIIKSFGSTWSAVSNDGAVYTKNGMQFRIEDSSTGNYSVSYSNQSVTYKYNFVGDDANSELKAIKITKSGISDADVIKKIPAEILNDVDVEIKDAASGSITQYSIKVGNVAANLQQEFGSNIKVPADAMFVFTQSGVEYTAVKEDVNANFIKDNVNVALGSLADMMEERKDNFSAYSIAKMNKEMQKVFGKDAAALEPVTKDIISNVFAGKILGYDLASIAKDYSKDFLGGQAGQSLVTAISDVQGGVVTVLNKLDTFLNSTLNGITGHNFNGASAQFISVIVKGKLSGDDFSTIAKNYAAEYAKSINLDERYQAQIKAAINLANVEAKNIDNLLNNTVGKYTAPFLGDGVFKGVSEGLVKEVINELKDGKDVKKVADQYLKEFGDDVVLKAQNSLTNHLVAVANSFSGEQQIIEKFLNDTFGGLAGNGKFFSGASSGLVEKLIPSLVQGKNIEAALKDFVISYAKEKGSENFSIIKVNEILKAANPSFVAFDSMLNNKIGAVISPVFGQDLFNNFSTDLLSQLVHGSLSGDKSQDIVQKYVTDFAKEKFSGTANAEIEVMKGKIAVITSGLDSSLNKALSSIVPLSESATFFNGISNQFLDRIINGAISGDNLSNVVKDFTKKYIVEKGIDIAENQLQQLLNPLATKFKEVGDKISLTVSDAITPIIGKSVVDGVGLNFSAITSDIVKHAIAGDNITAYINDIAATVVKQAGSKFITSQVSDLFGKSIGESAAVSIAATAIAQGVASMVQSGKFKIDRDTQQKILLETAKIVIAKELGINLASGQGAGLLVGVNVLVSAALSGDEINEKTLRSALVATINAVAAEAIATAILVYAGYGTAVGGPIGAAIGAVIGAALYIIEDSVFGIPAQTVFHHETIGSYVDGDTIIGIRKGGALLRTSIKTPNAIGSDSGADVLLGSNENNVLLGMGNDDMLEGRDGDDYIQGGLGNDHIEGGIGNDYIEGNEGHDKIIGGNGDDAIIAGAGNDIVAGGDGNDRIEGNEGDDIIYGDLGDDVIIAGAGNDNVFGGKGNDIISGEDGDDVIDGSDGNDEIHGGAGNDMLLGGAGEDLIHGDSGSDVIYGGSGIDAIYGDNGDDFIDAGSEDDLVFGGIGNDVILGSGGDDFIYGEIGDDYLIGGKGNDTIGGGVGNDVYIFNKADGKDVVQDGGGNSDVIRLVNYLARDISMIKSGNDLVLTNAAGDDQILIQNQFAGNAVEYLMFSDGKIIDLAGLTFDVSGKAVYNFVTDSTKVNAISNQATYADIFDDNNDRYYQTKNLSSSWYENSYSLKSSTTSSEIYNDVQVRVSVIKHSSLWRTWNTYDYYDYFRKTIDGDSGSNRVVGAYWNETINGNSGLDQLYGNGGDDTLDGGSDDDLIYGGSQNDILLGNVGNDLVYGGMGNDNLNGGDGNDTLYGEWDADLVHGGNGDDMISGGSGVDNLYGDSGNDVLYGNEDNDKIYGNDGNDFAVGGSGNDVIEGGAGSDYLQGDDGDDILFGGFTSGSSTLDGNDKIYGGAGNDKIYGNEGDDILIGEEGGDYIDGGDGNDTVSYISSIGEVNVNLATNQMRGGDAEKDQIFNVENIIGSDYSDTIIGNAANNILIGGYGNDSLTGGAGDDILQGDTGADYLDGGDGNDTVSYQSMSSAIDINLWSNVTKNGEAEGDVIVNVENIIGTNYDDRFILGGGNVAIATGSGKDTIVINKAANSRQVITDLSTKANSRDILDLSAFNNSFADFRSLIEKSTVVGNDLEINLGDGQILVLKNTSLASSNSLLLQDSIIGTAAFDRVGTSRYTSKNPNFSAQDDAFTTKEDTEIFISFDSILANDKKSSAPLTKDDVVLIKANNGTITKQDSGILYKPNQDYNGEDFITYQIRNSSGYLSNVAKINLKITPVGDAPIAKDDGVFTVVEDDNKLKISLDTILANDTDAAGKKFTGTKITLLGANHGTATFDGNRIIYTPDQNYSGSDVIAYKIKGSDGTYSNIAFININVTEVNDAPTVTKMTYNLVEDNSITIKLADILANANDVEDGSDIRNISFDNVVFSIDTPSKGSGKKQNDTPAIGNFVLNRENNSFTYIPAKDRNGIDTVYYQIKDSQGALSEKAAITFKIAAVNDAPIVNSAINTLEALTDSSFLVNISDFIKNNVIDVDNSLTISIKKADGSNLPSWLKFNGTTLSGTPTTSNYGLENLVLTASDGVNQVSTEFNLIVTSNLVMTSGASLVDVSAKNNKVTQKTNKADFVINGNNPHSADMNYLADGKWLPDSATVNSYSGVNVDISNKNKTFDSFSGRNVTDTLNLTTSSDVLLLEDVLSPTSSVSGVRIASVEIINTNGGDDVVNLSSSRFTYGKVTLNGNSGNDVLWSNDGDDQINGNGGNDNIHGGRGNDTISGGDGNDNITGGLGSDNLTGGLGNDVFVFNLNDSRINTSDLITDFTKGQDRIDLSLLDFIAISHTTDSGDESILSYHFESGTTIIQDHDQSFKITLSGEINLDHGDFNF